MICSAIDIFLGVFMLIFFSVVLAAAVVMGIMNTGKRKRKKRDRKNRYQFHDQYNDPNNWL